MASRRDKRPGKLNIVAWIIISILEIKSWLKLAFRRVHRIKYRKAAIFFAPALLEIWGKPLDKKDKIINKAQNFTKLEKKHKTSPETCSKLG